MQLIPTPRVLIVEDDPALAHLIQTLLQDRWFECVVRRSGAQGVDAFLSGGFDLIITDLNMAAGDGITLIETIRRTSRTPVIIVTGFQRKYADRMKLLGQVTVIGKPFEFKELLAAAESALQTGDNGMWQGHNIATAHQNWTGSL